ncbi:MAG: hypothetical protein ABEK04_03050, partial [Candidatus Nanohalobium sp.]
NPGQVSSSKNIYRGMLNSSMPQLTEDEPMLFVYDHSPGFPDDATGMAKVRGRVPQGEAQSITRRSARSPQPVSNDVETKYIPFRVESEDALPNAQYDGEGVPEVVLEHEEIDMREGYEVSINVLPYDPEDVTGESWQQNLQNYDGGEVSFRQGS